MWCSERDQVVQKVVIRKSEKCKYRDQIKCPEGECLYIPMESKKSFGANRLYTKLVKKGEAVRSVFPHE